MLFYVNQINWITFFSAAFAQVLLMFVAGLTLCCTATHHQPESLCAAPQLLIALAGRLQPFCRLARLPFVHLSPLTEAPARSAKSVPDTVTIRFAMQSQLRTLCYASQHYAESCRISGLSRLPAFSCAEGYRMITS